MKIVTFTVPGKPFGKERPKVATRKANDGRVFSKAYTPKKTVIYENQVKTEYHNQVGDFKFPDGAELDVRIMAYYEIPKSTSKKRREMMLKRELRPTKKPDFDNVAKVICDSLNGIAYHDDNQIVDGMFRKFYSDRPRIDVTIMQIGGLEE